MCFEVRDEACAVKARFGTCAGTSVETSSCLCALGCASRRAFAKALGTRIGGVAVTCIGAAMSGSTVEYSKLFSDRAVAYALYRLSC